MGKFDFASAKTQIAEIVEIVRTVPENFQSQCFELLFNAAFSEKHPAPAEGGKQQQEIPPKEPDNGRASDKKLPSNILALMHRHTISKEQISKLFMFEHDPLLPVYKIPAGNIARAQLLKVMMVMLENGLLNNSIAAPFTELRDAVRDDGFFDKNFGRNMRRNAGFFRGTIREDDIDEGGSVELSGEGMEELAKVIKELSQ